MANWEKFSYRLGQLATKTKSLTKKGTETAKKKIKEKIEERIIKAIAAGKRRQETWEKERVEREILLQVKEEKEKEKQQLEEEEIKQTLAGSGATNAFFADRTNSFFSDPNFLLSQEKNSTFRALAEQYSPQQQGGLNINNYSTGSKRAEIMIGIPSAIKMFNVKRSLSDMTNKEVAIFKLIYVLHMMGIYPDEHFLIFELSIAFSDGKGMVIYTGHGDLDDTDAIAQEILIHYLEKRLPSANQSIQQGIEFINKSMNETTIPDVVKEFLRKSLNTGNQWALQNELSKDFHTGSPNPLDIFIGEINGDDVFYQGEGSLITIAPPGAGKTQCNVFTNLLNYKGSVIVLDIKGECYEKTSIWRSENTGSVIRFAPFEDDNEFSYNPLAFVRDDLNYVWEDSRYLAGMLIIPKGKDANWEQRGRDVVIAAIAYTAIFFPPEERNMQKILDIMQGTEEEWNMFIDTLKGSDEQPTIAPMRRAGNTLGRMPEKQLAGVLDGAIQHLSSWEGHKIEKATSHCDWTPDTFRNNEPTTLYICIPPNKIKSHASFLRVIIAQHIRILTNKLPDIDQNPILFLLDEIAQLGYMEPVEEALEIGRQYGLKLWLFSQNTGQLDVYPNPEGILSNCAVEIYMNPRNDIARKISERLGYQEGLLDGERRKLAEPTELTGGEYQDYQIVFSHNMKPAKVKKVFAYEKYTSYTGD